MPKRQLHKAQLGDRGCGDSLVGISLSETQPVFPRCASSTQIGLENGKGRHWILKGN
jgi:hypothetical protein